jgi:hypothetical protein
MKVVWMAAKLADEWVVRKAVQRVEKWVEQLVVD